MPRKYFAGGAVVIAGMAALSGPAQAAVVYSNLVPVASLTGDQSINGPTGAIFDDVLIDNTINNTGNLDWLEVQSVTVGNFFGRRGGGAVTVTGYYGTTTTPANPNDFPILNNPQTLFGSVAVPAFLGGTEAVEFYTITPATPFVVALNLTDQPTFSEFAIGLQFSNTSPNAWAVAVPDSPDTNLDGAWDSDLPNNTNAAYSLDLNGQPLYTTFALAVNGTLVPEPASLALLSLAAGVPLARRRVRN